MDQQRKNRILEKFAAMATMGVPDGAGKPPSLPAGPPMKTLPANNPAYRAPEAPKMQPMPTMMPKGRPYGS